MIRVQNEGSLFILYGDTEQAKDWIDENLPHDSMLWGGAKNPGVVVEPRYVDAILTAAANDGLEILA